MHLWCDTYLTIICAWLFSKNIQYRYDVHLLNNFGVGVFAYCSYYWSAVEKLEHVWVPEQLQKKEMKLYMNYFAANLLEYVPLESTRHNYTLFLLHSLWAIPV